MSSSREISVRPGYHRCATDRSKNYGISNPRLIWTLKLGVEGISWEMFTDWGMPDDAFNAAVPNCAHPAHQDGFPRSGRGSTSGAVDWHLSSDVLGGMPFHENCIVTGGPCWSDVGYLVGDELFDLARVEGSDAVWNRMEELLVGYRVEVAS